MTTWTATLLQNVAQDIESIFGQETTVSSPMVVTSRLQCVSPIFATTRIVGVLEIRGRASWSKMAEVFTRFPNSEGSRWRLDNHTSKPWHGSDTTPVTGRDQDPVL